MALEETLESKAIGRDFEPTASGSNQIRVRAYNERLILDLVRRRANLSKADIARLSGLSAQTISVIMRSLEKDGLLIRGEPNRGRVGQPSIPMRLNPDAVLSIGIKIGRRSIEIVLIDFVGTIRHRFRKLYPYPMPTWITDYVREGVAELEEQLSEDERARIAGVGIATPFELWNWADEVGAPSEDLEQWRNIDLQKMVSEILPYPVFLQNDATSACGAELVFGHGALHGDYLYFFIGSFIGGGVVLNSALYTGKTGTAGAIGPFLVQGSNNSARSLIRSASIIWLEHNLKSHGIDTQNIWENPDDWYDYGQILDDWIADCATSLAQAIISSASIIDFSAMIIDGSFPNWVRKRIVDETREALGRLDHQGIILPQVLEGSLGSQARAIGGAALPLLSRYLLDQNVLLK